METGALETCSLQDIYAALAERLTSRRQDIQCEILSRIRQIEDEQHAQQVDAVYLAGLRTTVADVVEYVIKAIETGGEQPLEIPSQVPEQARLAARNGIGVDTVLKRYVMGSRVLQNFITEAAKPYPAHVLTEAVDLLGAKLEKVVRVAGDAHKAELERLARPSDRLEAERIERLLKGESVPDADSRYKIEALWHIALIATGSAPRCAIEILAKELGCEMQALQHDERTVWGWLGSPARIQSGEFERATGLLRIADTKLAAGESLHGLRGWRESHRQAQAALTVAQRRDRPVTRWFDVSLEALALQDESYARRMIAIYLGDLARDDTRMRELRQTLRAYLTSGQINKSAAVLLKRNPRTVELRRHTADNHLGYDVKARHAELDIALRVYELLEGHE